MRRSCSVPVFAFTLFALLSAGAIQASEDRTPWNRLVVPIEDAPDLNLGYQNGAWRPFSTVRNRGLETRGTVTAERTPNGYRLQVDNPVWSRPGGSRRDFTAQVDLIRAEDGFRAAYRVAGHFGEREGESLAAILPPWPMPVADWRPVRPNEHPRLFFRRDDIPELRRRAQTEAGQAMVARLRELLGNNGEALPTVFNEHPPSRYGARGIDRLPIGAYTTWHGTGYGYLFVLTGDRRYAQLAREAVELAFEGKLDRDERYNWVNVGGEIRVGPVVAAIALAYDLAFDGWDPAFRQEVARRILAYESPQATTDRTMRLDTIIRNPRHHPANNHWGSQVGGAGVALLAIRGDDGVDHALVDEYLEIIRYHARLQLEEGYGGGGWHSEGTHPGRIPATTGFMEFMRASRVADGWDYLPHSDSARWMVMRWAMEIVPRGGRTWVPHRGDYGDDHLYGRGQMISHGGEFSHGFGVVEREDRQALRWVWDHFVSAGEHHFPFDTGMYPHRAVHALISWPIDEPAVNPGETLPRVLIDREKNYAVFRERWQDGGDAVVTALFGHADHRGFKHESGGPVRVWARGHRVNFQPGFRGARIETVHAREGEGSAVITAREGDARSSLAVDMSGDSGAVVLVALAGGRAAPRDDVTQERNGVWHVERSLEAGGIRWNILAIAEGQAPEISVDGDTVRAGGQTLRLEDGRIRVASWER